MECYIADMSDEQQAEDVLIAYYLLFSEDLQCVEQRKSPSLEYMQQDNVVVVVCHEDDEVLGVTCVQDGSVMYPVLSGDYGAVLRCLILKSRECVGRLVARTENELILQTAVEMGIGVTRNGYWLEFN